MSPTYTPAQRQAAEDDEHRPTAPVLPSRESEAAHAALCDAWSDGYNHGLSDGQRSDGHVSLNPYPQLAARQPAPTVSAEAVSSAARPIAAEMGKRYYAHYRQGAAEAALTEALRDLGIEVRDV